MKYFILFFASTLLCQHTIAQEKQLESFIQSYAYKNIFNGTVLIEKDSTILYHESFGIADRRFNLPVTNETVYKVASVKQTLVCSRTVHSSIISVLHNKKT